MRADLYPIADCPVGKLAIMPRPRGGDWLDGEVESWRRQGMHAIISLLDDAEIEELELNDEEAACSRARLRFMRFEIPDRGVPLSTDDVLPFVVSIVAELRGGRGVGIHCRMGVGRSASLAVCVLASLGMSVDDAWAAIEHARGVKTPDTAAQKQWVAEWCARLASNDQGQ